jgi:hypothetical protein
MKKTEPKIKPVEKVEENKEAKCKGCENCQMRGGCKKGTRE